jgi:hypothetical protein
MTMLPTIDLLQLTSNTRINEKVLIQNHQLKEIIAEFSLEKNFKNPVVAIVETVCGYSIQELQSLCVKMEDVLNYNFNYCVNELENIELQKFEQACIENLKSRYD